DRVRRREAQRRESLRCLEGRLLREVLTRCIKTSLQRGFELMTTRIDRKIVKYRVQKPEHKAGVKAPDTPADKAEDAKVPAASGEEVVRDRNGRTAKVIRMHEKLERPEMLIGSTYKIKTPISDHAMYVTINDIVLNEGTEYEQRRPFEIFINSKNLDHFQWIVALTRIISAVFRKGGDTTFL